MPNNTADYPKRLNEPKCVAQLPRFLLVLILAPWIVGCGKQTEVGKLPAESSPNAGQIAPKGQMPVTADLRVKVGVVMKSGDVKPVARTDFALSKLSLKALLAEELKANPPPTEEAFCKTQHFSLQLLELLARFKWQLRDFQHRLLFTGNGNTEGFTVEDVTSVRELEKPFDDSFAAKKRFDWMDETQKTNDAMGNVYLGVDRKVREIAKNYESEVAAANAKALATAQARLMAANPVIAKTTLSGEAVFRDVPAGDYFVSNVDYSQIGESGLLWDLAVKLSERGENYIELSNDNAWRNY